MQTLEESNPTEFDFTPSTYKLTEEREKFEEERKKEPRQLWLVKPASVTAKKSTRIIDSETPIYKNLNETGLTVRKYI